MRHRDLLAAIADLEPIHVEGTFERHSSLRWEELKASAAGGRWGERRAFEVLYLGRPRDSVGLSDTQLCSPVGDHAACQAVGAAAHQLALAGIIAPAATQLGETLALFPTNLPVEHWPTVIARDIWHGLPADPRRLRAVDDDAS